MESMLRAAKTAAQIADSPNSKHKEIKISKEVKTNNHYPLIKGWADTDVTYKIKYLNHLNEQIQKYSIGWDITRISKLTRTVLQLAMFEILYMEDVPTGVAISEAVRIAKMYDGSDTGSFVNGILGSFARGLAEDAQHTDEVEQ